MKRKYTNVFLQKKRLLDLKCLMYKTFTISGKLTWMYMVLLVTEMIKEETKECRS